MGTSVKTSSFDAVVKAYPKTQLNATKLLYTCRENAAGNNGKGRKKTPEELSVEVLLHFVGTVRAFYSSVAKAVHAQARRRDDPSFQPNASMLFASVTVGIILRHNLLASAQVMLHLMLFTRLTTKCTYGFIYSRCCCVICAA